MTRANVDQPTMSSGEIELTPLSRGALESGLPQQNVPTSLTADVYTNNSGDERLREEEAVALAPVDGGIQAWTFVFCSFVLESLVWGFPFSFGVFQEWYLSHPPFDSASEASINAIGTVTLAIQYMEGIVFAFIAQRFPHWLRPMMVGGLVVCVTSMLISSFATKVWHLILLQGVVYGIAGGCLYMPVVFWLSEWFVERRSFAGSFIFGGSGLGGAAFPIVANYLLQRVGFRWTIRAIALAVGALGGLAILGVKPRLPIPPASRRTRAPPLDFSFIKSPVFISVGITVFLQALAYFPVSLYIPTYAVSLGYSRLHGTLALTVFNLATVIGQIVSGYYCDVGPYTRVMFSSAILSSILAYALWGFAHSLALVYVFVVIFGTISGGFSSVWPPAAAEVHRSQPFSPFAFFAIAKGLAAVFGPFIAAALHPVRIDNISASKLGPGKHGWAGYGFTSITIFVGSMMAATTVGSAVSAFLRMRMKRST
ncbi:MFS general substrate transporter [Auriscalpium vulgare]|uniref:MFS general substrate transporter n=1 Tax=Auriscalpium vulgare TaxID=40419 RepID=A0ACB8RWE7_9AGAM|nr:MFS general substrate transporter [Auriscalpium vulgare]